jgi:hypothetical protein
MKTKDDITLVAPCGLHCGTCAVYKVKDDPSLREALVKKVNWNGIPCPGCRPIKGKSQFISETCSTYACVTERGHDFCYQCADFPCGKLNPAADRADVLPHNLKIFNLSFIKQHGVARFQEEEPGIKLRYYRGKTALGKGPQLE